MTATRTTAAELIAMLSELEPDTHVFVDIGNHDWDYSDAIRLHPVTSTLAQYNPDKKGAVHLGGYDGSEVDE